MSDALTNSIKDLVVLATERATTPEYAQQLEHARGRLEGPLRVAIAGKVKAGKSTLLNALLGEELAPTDAGECTQIVTWYERSDQPKVTLHPRHGDPEIRPYRRAGALDIDLGGRAPADVDHLQVGWPTGRLQAMTILDTPGIASISADVSARTQQALSADDGRVPVADAVLYLLRHTHASDIHFLESFHDDELAQGTPMNAIGVLSRADEIGACRLDALVVAARVARRYEREPRLRRLCPLVVPVAGLLGYAGATLRESEFGSLAVLASAPIWETDELLLTADRFAARHTDLTITEAERQHLLARLGLFGVRMCIEEIRSGRTRTASELSEEINRQSGLAGLRSVLLRQFEDRSRVLKARSALATVSAVLAANGCHGAADLGRQVEEITAGAHAFAEVRILDQLRSGALDLDEGRAAELDRLLGGSGHDAATRLGLPSDSSTEEVRSTAISALGAWQRFAEDPMSSRRAQVAARGAIRTIEGLLAEPDQMSPSRTA